jgi:hypothetical protein
MVSFSTVLFAMVKRNLNSRGACACAARWAPACATHAQPRAANTSLADGSAGAQAA